VCSLGGEKEKEGGDVGRGGGVRCRWHHAEEGVGAWPVATCGVVEGGP
jgi:hypothetical protein